MVGEFALSDRGVHEFDQIQAQAISALRAERLGFIVVLRDNVPVSDGPMHALTAFACLGTSQKEFRDFLEMTIEFAQREIETIDALDV